jgi:hypothetical protein
MNLPYLLRLLWLCAAAFFVLHTVAAAAVWSAAPAVLRRCRSLRPRRAAFHLFTLRLLPPVAAGMGIALLCVPSYLRFEPRGGAERAGALCCAAAILGAGVCAVSATRALRGLVLSARGNRRFRREGRRILLPGETVPAVLLEETTPLLALVGLLKPRIVVSRGVLAALSPGELEAAVLHERAHRLSRDNVKRLVMLLAPEPFPFSRRYAAIERSWRQLTEWAGDDDAVGGDAQRSVALAGALVRVARLGGRTMPPSPLFTSLVADTGDLSARVNRLLAPPRPAVDDRPHIRALAGAAGLSLAALLVILVSQSPALSLVHRLLEALIN